MKTILCAIISLSLLISPDLMSQCQESTATTLLDANNVSANMLAGGDVWGNKYGHKYEVPAGSGIEAFYTGSIWMAGLDDEGMIHLAAQRYRQLGNDFFPGPLDVDGETYEETCLDFDRHWKVTKTMINDFKNGNNSSIEEAILTWPGKGNPNGYGITSNLAPFIDRNNDGIYNAEDGDYPNILGDQAVWWVINDAGNNHSNTGGVQIGLEIHIMAYAYAKNDVLNNTTFYNYTVLNKSGKSYHDFYMGIFTDPDLGNPIDDYIGCNKELELGFAYNGDDMDENITIFLGYGSNLPVVGTKILQNPKNVDGLEIPLSSFGYMVNYNDTFRDPQIAAQYYNRLKGLWNDGEAYTLGGNALQSSAETVKFVFPGNPSDGAQWSECSESIAPGDRKYVQSFGPMQLTPSVPVTFSYAAIWDQNPAFQGACPDLTPFFNSAEQVQAFHDSTHCEGFEVSISGSVITVDNVEKIEVAVLGDNSGELYYQWSNGSNEKDLILTETGIYTLTVSNDFGCSESIEFDVNTLAIASPKQLEINVYPNPSNSGLFNISAANKSLNASVFDVVGNRLMDITVNTELSLESQPSGIYFVKFFDGTSERVIRLMISH